MREVGGDAVTDALIVDLGSCRVKCGLARAALAATGAAGPRPPLVFPAVAGRPRFPRTFPAAAVAAEVVVGWEAHPLSATVASPSSGGVLRLSQPIRCGTIADRPAARRLLQQAVCAALLPAYYSGLRGGRQRADDDGDGDGDGGKGVRAAAARIDEHQRRQQERRQQAGAMAAAATTTGSSSSNMKGADHDDDGGLGGVFDEYRRQRATGRHSNSNNNDDDDGGRRVAALVEHPFSSRRQRAEMAEALLEGGGDGTVFGGVFCGVAPLLALYASGATTGLAIDIGDAVVSTAAAVGGHSLSPAMQRSDGVCGGDAATDLLSNLLRVHGGVEATATATGTAATPPLLPYWHCSLAAGGAAAHARIRDLKERCCSVLPLAATTAAEPPLDGEMAATGAGRFLSTRHQSEAELQRARAAARVLLDRQATAAHLAAAAAHAHDPQQEHRQRYTLPDGSTVVPGVAALQAAEVHFRPWVAGHSADAPGAADLLWRTAHHDSIANATVGGGDDDVAAALLGHVVLAGGATATAGFAPRMLSELQALAPPTTTVRVVAARDRAVAPWVGTAMLSQLSTFPAMCVGRDAFLEEGEAALHARLFV